MTIYEQIQATPDGAEKIAALKKWREQYWNDIIITNVSPNFDVLEVTREIWQESRYLHFDSTYKGWHEVHRSHAYEAGMDVPPSFSSGAQLEKWLESAHGITGIIQARAKGRIGVRILIHKGVHVHTIDVNTQVSYLSIDQINALVDKLKNLPEDRPTFQIYAHTGYVNGTYAREFTWKQRKAKA